MRASVFPALALLILAGCAGVQVKDCGTDFNCFIAEMDKNCSPAKVQYVEIGINASFEITGPASLIALRSAVGLCATKVKINDFQRTEEMDNNTWERLSAAIPLLKLAEMTCNISPRTAEALYSMHSVLLAAETLSACSGSLLDILKMGMGSALNVTRPRLNVTVPMPNLTLPTPIYPLNLTVPMPNITYQPNATAGGNQTPQNQTFPPQNNTSTGTGCYLTPATVYMSVWSDHQGEIRGDVTIKGHEETIMVLDLDRSILSPRDAASGLPTGKRVHSPVVITKRIDKASPLLMKALVDNENLEVQLSVYGATKSGLEMLCYTIQLADASIAGIKQYMNFNETAGITGDHLEEVSFAYQKITWTYEPGGIISEDDWETPIV